MLFSHVSKAASGKNGQCLSTEYLNVMTKMTWKCQADHIWEAPLKNIRYNNNWCRICAIENSKKFVIADVLLHNNGAWHLNG